MKYYAVSCNGACLFTYILSGKNESEIKHNMDGHYYNKEVLVIEELPKEFSSYVQCCEECEEEDSYLASTIKTWVCCLDNIHNKYKSLRMNRTIRGYVNYIDSEYDVKHLLSLWGDDAKFKPNPNVYYFIRPKVVDGRHTMVLTRDLTKSPKKQ